MSGVFRAVFELSTLAALLKIGYYFVIDLRRLFDASQTELFDFRRAVATSDADSNLRISLDRADRQCVKRAIDALRYYKNDFENWGGLLLNASRSVIAVLITLGLAKREALAGWLSDLPNFVPLWVLLPALVFTAVGIIATRYGRLQSTSRTIQIFEEYLTKSDVPKLPRSKSSETAQKAGQQQPPESRDRNGDPKHTSAAAPGVERGALLRAL
jgi:hypothetical protein